MTDLQNDRLAVVVRALETLSEAELDVTLTCFEILILEATKEPRP